MAQTSTRPRAGRIGTRQSEATAPAQRVGRWELVEPVAEGRQATVWRARAEGTSDPQPVSYALKILHERLQTNAEAVSLFCREAQVGRQVRHPNVISILAAGLDAPPYYLVMPWLEGQTLRARLDSSFPLSLPEALWIARQTVEALGGLASAGWRHGDVKPSNLFLSPEGHVTLLDLGFARRANQPDSVADRCITGTAAYWAPETITSTLAADVRSDLYSLGVVLFEVLSGRLPFEAESLEALATAHRQSRPRDLRRLAPGLPPVVVRLVQELLAKDPLRRPQTPEELIDRLTALEILTFDERHDPELLFQ
ncbi:MAG: serine/threonine protein kinase [Pirellulales bacterium]|nr:serine/threonine protein kinase [Pirellulales bacterium]